jgi:hypothetical protein
MPDGLVLASGYVLRVTAIDPSSGSLVAGVNVGLEVITGTETSDFVDGGSTLDVGPYMLVPGSNA